ncbi:YheC/YheD family protein [Paenibacillus tarimensis]
MKRSSWKIGVMASLPRGDTRLTKHLPEDRFCRSLCVHGPRFGMDVYVFSPVDYNDATGDLYGFKLKNGEWSYEKCPLPEAVYDRSSCMTSLERSTCESMLNRMKQRKQWIRLGTQLPGKAAVYRSLEQSKEIADMIPRTERYVNRIQLSGRLNTEAGGIILKPDAGMQGRGIIRIYKDAAAGKYQLRGRTGGNRSYAASYDTLESCAEAAHRKVAGRHYLIQPYLNLTDKEDVPFDIRVLVQKEARGRWSVTGIAVRCGESGSVTANLHGGGTAKPAEPALREIFGKQTAEQLLRTLPQASLAIAERLEQSFGRLLELGIDFGIEPDGRIWLLEANSKPGRSLFTLLNQCGTAEQSVVRPLLYARLLCARRTHQLFK